MPILQPTYAEVRVLVYPLDPDAVYRTPCALSDSYAGLILPDRGESARDETPNQNSPGLPAPIEWQGQTLLKELHGPFEWLHFLPNGTIARGVRQAATPKEQQEARHDLRGWSIRPQFTRLQSTIADPPKIPGSPDYDLRPRLPQNQPVLKWFAQQGDKWERVTPVRTPQWSSLHYRGSCAGRAVKVKSERWGKNEGAGFELDCDGVSWGHEGEPGVRLEWGNSWSLVFRGVGKDARPRLERKGADKDGNLQWRVVRTFDGAAPLDEKWWKGRHTVFFYRVGLMLVVEIDGQFWWFADSKNGKFRAASWSASPLRLSIFGADVVARFRRLSFDREAGFKREVPVAAPPSSEISWTCEGTKMARISVPQAGVPQTGIPFFDAVIAALTANGKAIMKGTDLSETRVNARWFEVEPGLGRIDYEVKLKGTAVDAPLLCAFAAQFPPTATNDLPEPVNLRACMESVEVETGEPERMPTGNAKFVISVPMAERVIPRWDELKDVLPFRRVRIECDENNDGNWKPIFNGRIFPDGLSSDGFNSEKIGVTCYDLMCLLKEPAALVDGRFGPLDLDADFIESGTDLYGGQCIQKLLAYEIGPDEAGALNGNGDWRRFFPASQYPLINNPVNHAVGNDYKTGGATDIPSGGFLLPPSIGEDIERWVGKIKKFDGAAFFFDGMEGVKGSFIYGQLPYIYAERGQIIHALHETDEGVEAQSDKRLTAWPLLSSYSAQGLLDKAYTRVQVWGSGQGVESFSPSLFVGAATTPLPATDPLSELQSWPRTYLSRQDFIAGRVQTDYAQSLAELIWREFDGQAPERVDFTLNDQILVKKWGEKVVWKGEEKRVLSSKLSWQFGESSSRVTTITARSLSATGL